MFKLLLSNWKQHGLQPREGVSCAAISAFENRHGVMVPSDMRDYFLSADGMTATVSDDETSIRFWPLEELKPAYPKYSPNANAYDQCFVFADYLMESHHYGIYLGSRYRDNIVIVTDPFPLRVARSFSEFVERYLEAFYELFTTTDPIDYRLPQGPRTG